MKFQTDGNGTLAQQELQLQGLETFFVEVIDFQAGEGMRNDVMTKDVAHPVNTLHLQIVQNSAEMAAIATAALSIVFDRVVFVAAKKERVIGFRKP